MNRRLCYLALAGAAGCAAVTPPLDRLADSSFAWHMVQHMLLLYVAPLLALLSQPFGFFAAAAGKARTAWFVRISRPLHAVASPWVALPAYAGTLWITHFSPLYELSLEHAWIHAGEHLLYVVAGTLFWMPVLSPRPLRPSSYPARIFYLIAALPQGAFLGAVLTSAREPLYPHYAALMTPGRALVDQQNAAAIMWIGGGLIVLCALLATVGAWASRESEAYNESA